MATYLLTWKPSRWPWHDLAEEVREVETQGYCDSTWSSGRTKRIVRGDRLFLIRQGPDTPGIIASGWATSEVYEDYHFDKERPNDKALYVDFRIDTLLDPDTTEILRREDLHSGLVGSVNWNAQASGTTISPAAGAELEALWAAHLSRLGHEPISQADEVATPDAFFEGATKQVAVNVYERNPRAREKCIEHYGVRCIVCGFDFESAYGELGRGFIHVHHVVPLSAIGREYRLDPVRDLRPVCPNCHAMIHRGSTVFKIEALREQLKRRPSCGLFPPT